MYRVLAIDDDLDFQKILKLSVPSTVFEIKMASNEQEMILKLEESSFDLILLDLSFDESSLKGLEILNRLRTDLGFQAPIIVLSNNKNKKNISNALELGANDFMGKPLDGKLLNIKMRELISGTQAFAKEFKVDSLSNSKSNMILHAKQRLESISELGFVISGNAYVAKGSRTILKSKRILEIFGTETIEVFSTGFTTETSGIYFTTFEIDPDQKENINKVKAWIRENTE